MNDNESWYTDEIRKLLCKERYSTTSHHYFFELKEAKNGSKYIVIDQRKKIGSEFVGAKIRLFADEMLEFQRILNKLIQLVIEQESKASSISCSTTMESQSLPNLDEGKQAQIRPLQGLFDKAKLRIQHLWGRSQTKLSHTELQPGFFEKLTTTENLRNTPIIF